MLLLVLHDRNNRKSKKPVALHLPVKRFLLDFRRLRFTQLAANLARLKGDAHHADAGSDAEGGEGITRGKFYGKLCVNSDAAAERRQIL